MKLLLNLVLLAQNLLKFLQKLCFDNFCVATAGGQAGSFP